MRTPRQLLVVAAGAVLVLVLPSLLSAETPSGVVAAALLALALGALVRPGAGRVLLAADATGRARGVTRDLPPMRSGTVTDPVHHPLRPRAPGDR